MKTNFLRTAAVVLLCIATVCSCSKDGKDGRDGRDGTNGANGTNGADGSKMLSGTGAPAATLGAAGDFYFDTDARDIYGPKTATGWGTPVSLQGEDGAAGSKILSGTSAPAASVGAQGDWYINTSNARMYGPKGASGWPGTYTDLTGPQGIAGNAGTIMYVFGTKTFLNSTTYQIPVGSAIVVNSLFYCYYDPSIFNELFPVPGLGENNNYETRVYYAYDSSKTNINISLHNVSTRAYYGTSVTWRSFKVIVVPIPSGNIVQMSAKPSIDYSNYAEVAGYYGFE